MHCGTVRCAQETLKAWDLLQRFCLLVFHFYRKRQRAYISRSQKVGWVIIPQILEVALYYNNNSKKKKERTKPISSRNQNCRRPFMSETFSETWHILSGACILNQVSLIIASRNPFTYFKSMGCMGYVDLELGSSPNPGKILNQCGLWKKIK